MARTYIHSRAGKKHPPPDKDLGRGPLLMSGGGCERPMGAAKNLLGVPFFRTYIQSAATYTHTHTTSAGIMLHSHSILRQEGAPGIPAAEHLSVLVKPARFPRVRRGDRHSFRMYKTSCAAAAAPTLALFLRSSLARALSFSPETYIYAFLLLLLLFLVARALSLTPSRAYCGFIACR